MIRANFSDSGIVIGANDKSMTYLYGLSDFFEVMFKDTSTLNLMLEAESLVASEVYSRFLQMTSTLTLGGIQDATSSSLKLAFVTSNDLVSGEVNTYRLSEQVQSSRYVANKPFLPTELLDEKVDFAILQQADGSSWIRFAKPITTYSLPVRLLSDGITEQYAFWLVDAVIDENLVSTHFGNLLDLTPENASTQFSDFVYGLFYVYMYGPNLDTMSRGLNLVLGIPVARSVEIVLSIRQYLETDQYLVICDQNQYLIPYGLVPSVSEGDTLVVGESLASWVEIKDYTSNGDWWVNLYIPPRLIPQQPLGQKDRFAIPGSSYDFLMRNYLKAHTFLVKVNVANFKNLQQFSLISDLVKRVKPSYAEAIYIWALTSSEIVAPTDTMAIEYKAVWDDNLHPCISRMRRDNDPSTGGDPVIRGHHSFIRFNADKKVSALIGMPSYQSTYASSFSNGSISGYINPVSQYRANTSAESGWIAALMTRGSPTYRVSRNKIGFFRGASNPSTITGTSVRTENTKWNVDLTRRTVPLYTTTLADISAKMIAMGFLPPNVTDWSFELFSPGFFSQSINSNAINYLPMAYDPLALQKNYAYLMFRSSSITYLGQPFSQKSLETYAPLQTEVKSGDYLLCIRITQETVGVYWITTSTLETIPAFFTEGHIDPLVVTANMPASRGAGINGAPYYVTRGVRLSDYNTVSEAINIIAVNADSGSPTVITSDAYTDKYNSTPVVVDRTKVKFVHAVESI